MRSRLGNISCSAAHVCAGCGSGSRPWSLRKQFIPVLSQRYLHVHPVRGPWVFMDGPGASEGE